MTSGIARKHDENGESLNPNIFLE